MKILSLAQVDMSRTEAGVVHVMDLAKAMKDNNVDMDVIVISEGYSVLMKEWLKVYKIPDWMNFWMLKGVVCNLFALWILLKAYREHYDVIYVRYSPNIALALLMAKGKASLWLEVNGISRDEEEHLKRRFWHFGRIYVGRLLEWIAYKTADKCICVTPKIAEHLCENFHVPTEVVRVVPNGVDIETYKPMNKSYCRQKLGLEDGTVYLGFIGNFLAWQGIDTLLKELPPILEKWANVRALMIGDGERFEEYVKMAKDLGIADKVVLPGRVHKDIAPLWINSFDIGVVLKKPIISGYSPLKLYSYMACGICVLATDTTGFEPVQNYNAGILVPYGDSESLRKAIEMLVANEGLRIVCGANGRKCAEELFSWKATAKRILQ